MVPHKRNAVMLDILTQRVLVLSRKLLGVPEQHQGQVVGVMINRQGDFRKHPNEFYP